MAWVEAGLHTTVFAAGLLVMGLSFAPWSIEIVAVPERLLITRLKVSTAARNGRGQAELGTSQVLTSTHLIRWTSFL
jgi:hypothetical protein